MTKLSDLYKKYRLVLLGVGIAVASWVTGGLIYDHTGGHWQCRYDSAVADPQAVCDRGPGDSSTGWYHVGGNQWGILIGVLGVFVLSWLVPVMASRRSRTGPVRPLVAAVPWRIALPAAEVAGIIVAGLVIDGPIGAVATVGMAVWFWPITVLAGGLLALLGLAIDAETSGAGGTRSR